MTPRASEGGIVLALALTGAMLAGACDAGERAPVILPEAPTPVADAPLPRADFASELDVPILLDLAVILEELDEHVPRERVWTDVSVEGDGSPVALALTRGPFTASFQGEVASLSTTVAYALRTRYALPLLPDVDASCGVDRDRPAPRMDLRVEGPLGITSSWTLQSRVRVAHVGPSSSSDADRCEVTVFGVDVTERVADAAREFLADQAPAIDSIVRGVDLTPDLESWWETIREPVALGDDLWLDLGPEGIALGAVNGRGSFVELVVRLTARPRIVFGTRPRPRTTPLPAMGSSAERRSFRTAVHVLVAYDELGDLITRELADERFRAGRRSFHADRVSVTGIGGNRIAVAASIAGDARGTLYLVGTPSYSTTEAAVRFPDLEMSVETESLLVAGASWVLDAGIESLLRERVRWHVDEGVAWAEERLGEGLNATLGEELRLRGEVEELIVVGVSARADGLVIETRAAGRVELLVGDVR